MSDALLIALGVLTALAVLAWMNLLHDSWRRNRPEED